MSFATLWYEIKANCTYIYTFVVGITLKSYVCKFTPFIVLFSEI